MGSSRVAKVCFENWREALTHSWGSQALVMIGMGMRQSGISRRNKAAPWGFYGASVLPSSKVYSGFNISSNCSFPCMANGVQLLQDRCSQIYPVWSRQQKPCPGCFHWPQCRRDFHLLVVHCPNPHDFELPMTECSKRCSS